MGRLIRIWKKFGFDSMVGQLIRITFKTQVKKLTTSTPVDDYNYTVDIKCIAYEDVWYNNGDGGDYKECWSMYRETMVELFFGLLWWDICTYTTRTIRGLVVMIPEATREWFGDGMCMMANDVDPSWDNGWSYGRSIPGTIGLKALNSIWWNE